MDVWLKLVESVWDVEWPASNDFDVWVWLLRGWCMDTKIWQRRKIEWKRFEWDTLQKYIKCMRNINRPGCNSIAMRRFKLRERIFRSALHEFHNSARKHSIGINPISSSDWLQKPEATWIIFRVAVESIAIQSILLPLRNRFYLWTNTLFIFLFTPILHRVGKFFNSLVNNNSDFFFKLLTILISIC